jgi:N-acetyl-anhydromuramyl-L-alanine amidase AmpD
VSVDISAFIEARWYTPATGRRVDYIVLHDMEMGETVHTAEDCAHMFANLGPDRKASAHFAVDSNSIVQCVREKDIAYHAPPNLHSIGVEHAGFAR